jgi:hypothetical protein
MLQVTSLSSWRSSNCTTCSLVAVASTLSPRLARFALPDCLVSLQAEGTHEQALKAFHAAAAFLGDVRPGERQYRRWAVAGIRILCGLGTAELAAGHHAMAASVLERCLQVHACLRK